MFYHITDQATCLLTEGGGLAVDFIGRVEHVDEDMKASGQRCLPCGTLPCVLPCGWAPKQHWLHGSATRRFPRTHMAALSSRLHLLLTAAAAAVLLGGLQEAVGLINSRLPQGGCSGS